MTGPKAEECRTVVGERESLFDRLWLGGMFLSNRLGIRQNFIPWAVKGGLALLDQGLITGSNFVLGILLARWLSREQYGAFALGFSIFLLVAVLYQSLLLEPMAVFGGSVYREHLRHYLAGLLRIHLFVALAIFLALGISADVSRMVGHAGSLPGALAGAALASPCILILSLARRTFYLQLSPAFAVAGALLYCALVVGGLFLAQEHGFLSPFTAFLLIGLGGLLSGALLLRCFSAQLDRGTTALHLRDVWKRHWNYGRWALASACAGWIPSNIFYLLLSSFSGMGQAGELRALMNVAAPVLQTNIALSLLLLPYAARVQSREPRSTSLTWRITSLCLAGSIAYWAVVILFKAPAFHLLYSGKYMELVDLVPIVGLGSVIGSAFSGPAIVLRAAESPASVFGARCASSAFCLTVGVVATRFLGIRGAVWSMALAEALALLVAALLIRRKVHSVSPDSGLLPHPSTQLPPCPAVSAE